MRSVLIYATCKTDMGSCARIYYDMQHRAQEYANRRSIFRAIGDLFNLEQVQRRAAKMVKGIENLFYERDIKSLALLA